MISFKKQLLISVLSSLTLFCSCGEEEEKCDTNSYFESAGRGLDCTGGLGEITTRGDGEFFSLKFIGTDRGIAILSPEPIVEQTYDKFDGASFYFNGLLNLNSVSITITKLDRENQIISGYFESVALGSGGNIETTGEFNEVVYRD